jgi:hypothetical protein
MSNTPGEAQSGSHEEGMGEGHETYSQLGAIQQEADRYHAIADAARRDGDYELATRLDQYAADFDTRQDYLRWQVDRARTAVLEIARGERTRVHVTGFGRSWSTSEPTLAGIRSALLRPEDLAQATVEHLEDPAEGTSRFVVPMHGGMRYLETYDADYDLVEVTVEKSETASTPDGD